MENYLYIILIILLICLFAIFLLLVHRNNLKQQLAIKEMLDKSSHLQDEELDRFQASLSNQLLMYQNNMSDALRNELVRLNQSSADSLNKLGERTEQRLAQFNQNVNDNLLKNYEKTNESFLSLNKQVVVLQKAQEDITSLQDSIVDLQNVFLDKKSRGTFGEVELASLMKQVFGINDKRYMMQKQLSNGYIADCVLYESEPLGMIAIDSKFPLENYNRLIDNNLSKIEHNEAENLFKKDIKKHIDDISKKYIIPYETAEIAYMFVPAEAIFAEIYGRHDDLVQYAYSKHVYIVSPTTLMAYLTAMRSLYINQEKNEKAKEIQIEYAKLEKEFERFNTRYTTMVKDFEKIYKDMQDITITTNKLINQFKTIHDFEFEDNNVDNSL